MGFVLSINQIIDLILVINSSKVHPNIDPNRFTYVIFVAVRQKWP